MNSLHVIRQGCIDAIEEEVEDVPAWRAAYISVVDPQSVLEMTEVIEELIAKVETVDPAMGARIRATVGLPTPRSDEFSST